MARRILLFVCETRLCVSQAGLELVVQFSLWNAGITSLDTILSLSLAFKALSKIPRGKERERLAQQKG